MGIWDIYSYTNTEIITSTKNQDNIEKGIKSEEEEEKKKK